MLDVGKAVSLLSDNFAILNHQYSDARNVAPFHFGPNRIIEPVGAGIACYEKVDNSTVVTKPVTKRMDNFRSDSMLDNLQFYPECNRRRAIFMQFQRAPGCTARLHHGPAGLRAHV